MNTTRVLGVIAIVCLWVSGCGGGSGGSTPIPSTATAVIKATRGVTINPANTVMQAVVGRTLQLSGTASTDVGSSITGYAWTVTSKPSGSTAMPSSTNTVTMSFIPDVVGKYVLELQVTDAQGATSSQNLAITVTDVPPTASVVKQVTFNGQTTNQPPQQVDV